MVSSPAEMAGDLEIDPGRDRFVEVVQLAVVDAQARQAGPAEGVLQVQDDLPAQFAGGRFQPGIAAAQGGGLVIVRLPPHRGRAVAGHEDVADLFVAVVLPGERRACASAATRSSLVT